MVYFGDAVDAPLMDVFKNWSDDHWKHLRPKLNNDHAKDSENEKALACAEAASFLLVRKSLIDYYHNHIFI